MQEITTTFCEAQKSLRTICRPRANTGLPQNESRVSKYAGGIFVAGYGAAGAATIWRNPVRDLTLETGARNFVGKRRSSKAGD